MCLVDRVRERYHNDTMFHAMNLRPDQLKLVDDIRAAMVGGARTVCAQAPCGFGKTHTVAELLRRTVAGGKRAIFAAHLDAIVEDTYRRLTAAGVSTGYVQAGRPFNRDAPVQVCSLDTLVARPDERHPCDLFVFDECHRSMSPSYRSVLEHYSDAWVLGLTATPERADGQPLGDLFEALVSGPSVRELTQAGHLVPCDVIAPPTVEALGLAMDPVEAYLRFAPCTSAIVFADSIEHARALVPQFDRAELLIGETSRSERDGIRQRIESLKTRVIVGVRVFLEGFDCPPIETVILCQAFGFAGSFLQAIGRGLRTHPGKTRCTVIDLRGAVNLHGLPDEDRIWSLEGRACRRTETMTALRRCANCLAIYRPAKVCPRCGTTATTSVKLPRVLNRAEKMLRVDPNLPQWQKDERYMGSLLGRAYTVGRSRGWDDVKIRWFAMKLFVSKWHRSPAPKSSVT
jgi:DNA repair protein RadD